MDPAAFVERSVLASVSKLKSVALITCCLASTEFSGFFIRTEEVSSCGGDEFSVCHLGVSWAAFIEGASCIFLRFAAQFQALKVVRSLSAQCFGLSRKYPGIHQSVCFACTRCCAKQPEPLALRK